MSDATTLSNLATAARTLRENADLNILHRDITELVNARHPEGTMIEHNGQTFNVVLSRLALDLQHGLTCYLVFIHAVAPHLLPPNDVCERVCRAIYDVEWKEGPMLSTGDIRWFMRVRKDAPDHFAE